MNGSARRIARYEIERELGGGGMGTVYLARDPELGRRVAIKLIHAHLDSPELRERFTREARAVASLSHPNIVTVYDSGQFESKPFLVLEYIQGRPLASIISNREVLSVAVRLRWLEQLCDGLEVAHRAGIVHRDIKPANLMIDHLDGLKILDFGIARMAGAALTAASTPIGTPAFMAPEYIRGDPIDHRIDVFAAGAVAYELLTYRRAFKGENIATVMHNVLNREPDPIGFAEETADHAELERIVFKALRKQPEARFASAREFKVALAGARQRLAGTALAATPPAISDRASVRAESIDTPPPWGGRQTPATPRRVGLDSDAVRRRRDALIEAALARGEAHLADGRLDEAMAACVEAATLDESREATIALTARVRSGMDRREAEALLQQAREEIQRGELTAAQELLTSARTLASDLPDMDGLAAEIQRIRTEREAARQRSIDFRMRMGEARAALAADDLKEALLRVDQALQLNHDSTSAIELQAAVQVRLRERARVEEEARQVRELTDDARHRFALGDHEAAIQMLRACDLPSPLIARLADELQAERDEIARLIADVPETVVSTRTDPIAWPLEAEPETVVRRVPAPATHVDPGSETVPTSSEAATAPVDFEPPPPQARPLPTAGRRPPLPQRQRSEFVWPFSWPLLAGSSIIAIVLLFAVVALFRRAPDGTAGVVPQATEPVSTARTELAPVAARPTTPTLPTAPAPASTSPVQPAEPGVVILDATPWASVESITDAAGARQPLPAETYTPARILLPAGTYRIVVKNPVLNQTRTLDMRVQSGQAQTTRVTFNRVDADDYFERAARP
jgi:eukaryotic-like serine/threonine-protein kinase